MFAYRLTKYDPQKRNNSGHFTAHEWTSISDIGRTIGGHVVSMYEYLDSEIAYVESVRTLLSAANIGSMRVSDLERRAPEHYVRLNDTVVDSSRKVENDQSLSGENLEDVVRACLREYIWCRLTGPSGSYLHFGHDYYMYVGLPKAANVGDLPRGMFLEECESPLMSLDDSL